MSGEPRKMNEEPEILGLRCRWSSYAGADLAGTSRFSYPPNVRIVQVPCSGRVDPVMIFKAFTEGYDGVLVSGCHFGDCHYIFGNHRAVEQFEKTMRVVRLLGLEEGRVRLEWISAAEGQKFAKVMRELEERVQVARETWRTKAQEAAERLHKQALEDYRAGEHRRVRRGAGQIDGHSNGDTDRAGRDDVCSLRDLDPRGRDGSMARADPRDCPRRRTGGHP